MRANVSVFPQTETPNFSLLSSLLLSFDAYNWYEMYTTFKRGIKILL